MGWLGEGNKVWDGVKGDLVIFVMYYEFEFFLFCFRNVKKEK